MKKIPALIIVLGSLSVAAAPEKPEPPERKMLPDLSMGTTGRLGPFWWGRSLDLGEDMLFTDARGWPSKAGTYLWAHQFNRIPSKKAKADKRGLNALSLHARNNLVTVDPSVAWQVQPVALWLNTTGPHNAKITLGYVPKRFRFLHGDNTDLEHLADAPRVALFIPVRHQPGTPGTSLEAPFVSTIYAAQSISVLEFAPGEIIRYDWYRDPKDLDRHILCDLVPHLGKEPLRPGVTKPLFRFDLTDAKGGWRVRIERDGRDGLAGGRNPKGWDIDVRSGQPGARAYTVDLDPKNASWSLSLFSPGGKPAGTSQFLLGMRPYNRADDSDAPWPDRSIRQRTMAVERTRGE